MSDSGRTAVIRRYYEEKLDPESPDHRILGWESEDAHEKRLAALVEGLSPVPKEILDVGCGVGSLYRRLREDGFDCSYTGVDILPGMIDLARDRHPGASFLCFDLFKENPFSTDRFDLVCASGIFNIQMGNNREFFVRAMRMFRDLSRRHISVNLLSNRSPDPEPGYWYVSPDEALEMVAAAGISPEAVILRDDYLDNDLSLAVTL